MLNPAFTNRMKKRLEARRAALLHSRQSNVREEDALLAEKEPDFLDTSAERTAAAVLGRLAEAELDEILAIDAALARMAKGEWGLCETCGDRIGELRLEALPHAPRCIDCEASAAYAGA